MSSKNKLICFGVSRHHVEGKGIIDLTIKTKLRKINNFVYAHINILSKVANFKDIVAIYLNFPINEKIYRQC